MVRCHLGDEVLVHVAASGCLHVSHHGGHGRRAALEILSFSLQGIDRYGFEGTRLGPHNRVMATPKERDDERQARSDAG
jgi:hypothetical protein